MIDYRFSRTVAHLRSTSYGYAFSPQASEELSRNDRNEKFSEEIWDDIWRELCLEWQHDNPINRS